MMRVGNNESLYRKLLRAFYNDYADSTTKISAALSKQDHDGAQLLAHTVKNVSANIGAQDLSEVARILEYALKDKQTGELESLVNTFDLALKQVQGSLQNILAPC